MQGSADGCSETTATKFADGAAGFSALRRQERRSIVIRQRTPWPRWRRKAGPLRHGSPRRIEITIAGKEEDPKGGESWLAGKILEHAVGLAGDAFLQSRELEVTITVGARSATAKVTA